MMLLVYVVASLLFCVVSFIMVFLYVIVTEKDEDDEHYAGDREGWK
jgi:hypothetical protein